MLKKNFSLAFFIILSVAVLVPICPSIASSPKLATLTVIVKSNQNGMPIAGANITVTVGTRIIEQHRRKLSNIRVIRGETNRGGIWSFSRHALTGYEVGGKAMITTGGIRDARIEVEVPGFNKSEQSTTITYGSPNQTVYVYLSPS